MKTVSSEVLKLCGGFRVGKGRARRVRKLVRLRGGGLVSVLKNYTS